jgi:phenylpropionate dioxygenase-like ring-hydroxylating dioxygenase large terminal subunit
MLRNAETNFMIQTGSDTPMGTLLRRYWIPALLLSAVAEPNGGPVRVRLVGENFIAWRDANGKLGFFDEHCPHRGASLALGRSEGDGLRCLYHGWKFATDGTILETPNCKNANFREKLKAKVYPLREAGGLLWVYLGPKEKEPPFPHYKFFDEPAKNLSIVHATIQDCNWLQLLEGTVDPAHQHLLHPDSVGRRYTNVPASLDYHTVNDNSGVHYIVEDTAPECEVEDLNFGVHGIAKHEGVTTSGEPMTFAIVHTWVMPFMVLPSEKDFVITVPMDDTHTTFFSIHFPKSGPGGAQKMTENILGPADLYDHYRYRFGPDERWGQDRSKMRSGDSFTGIPGVLPEDIAMTMSMGQIYDRGREHLTQADKLIAAVRRRLIRAARDLEAGVEPTMLPAEEALELGAPWQLIDSKISWQKQLVHLTP